MKEEVHDILEPLRPLPVVYILYNDIARLLFTGLILLQAPMLFATGAGGLQAPSSTPPNVPQLKNVQHTP